MNTKERKPTEKQELFCRYHIIENLNGTMAYIKAYSVEGKEVKNNVARTQASKLLSKPNIIKRIDELKKERNKRLEIDADWVLKQAVEVYKIAKGEKPHIESVFKGQRWIDINTVKPEIKTQVEDYLEKNDFNNKTWKEIVLNDKITIRVKVNASEEDIVEVKQQGEWVKQQVHKTNIKEANNALNTIGKHVKVKAFEKEVELGGGSVFVVGLPTQPKEDEDAKNT